MSKKRKLIFGCLRFSGLPFLVRHLVQRNKVTILLYHDISKETAIRSFKRLKKCYNIISLQDYISWNKSGKTDKIPPKALIITFDDGHRRNYELLEVVNNLEIPITIFLCSAIVGTKKGYWFYRLKNHEERNRIKGLPEIAFKNALDERGIHMDDEMKEREALTASEIAEMKESPFIDFQSHTRYHYMLPKCGDELAEEEISGSKKDLKQQFNLPVNALAYPNGEFGEREEKLAKQAGYECLLTVNQDYNNKNQSLYQLNRISMNDVQDVNEMVVRASGLWRFFQK